MPRSTRCHGSRIRAALTLLADGGQHLTGKVLQSLHVVGRWDVEDQLLDAHRRVAMDLLDQFSRAGSDDADRFSVCLGCSRHRVRISQAAARMGRPRSAAMTEMAEPFG